jgi:hypothetical protein
VKSDPDIHCKALEGQGRVTSFKLPECNNVLLRHSSSARSEALGCGAPLTLISNIASADPGNSIGSDLKHITNATHHRYVLLLYYVGSR